MSYLQPTYAPTNNQAQSTEYDERRDRIKRGQCGTCGIQTHKVSFLRISLVPITDEHVLRGRCLHCYSLAPTPNAAAAPARPATSEAPGASVVAVPSDDEPPLAQAVGFPFGDNAGAPPSPTAPPITKLMAAEESNYAFNPSIIVPPPEISAASSLDNSAVESTTEAENAPRVSSNHVQHSYIEGGNGVPLTIACVHDAWRKWKHHWVSVVVVLVFISVGVEQLSEQTPSTEPPFTSRPTYQPTLNPTLQPNPSTTMQPSKQPTNQPTIQPPDAPAAVMVGDEVCITGYIMDNFCIYNTGGFLLDNNSVITLQYPEQHSFHCLLDVGSCYESGFQVLGDNNPDTDRHCLGFRLDDTDAVLAAGRAMGKSGICSTCTGGGDTAPEYGYRATVKGTVKELGDGSSDAVTGTPILTNVQMLDQSVGCDGNPTIPPLCERS